MASVIFPKSPFERLPSAVIGNILSQLNRMTGTEGIINEADIPVIMGNVRALACTSRQMQAHVDDPTATNLFLRSLSAKYNQTPEHLAAVLNTDGTRKWLWHYIKKNGYDRVYETIQDIYELAFKVLGEAKDAGIYFKHSEGRKGWPGPNPFYDQMKSGFLLYAGSSPDHIATPFGQIMIYGGGGSSGTACLSVLELFIKRLDAVFERIGFSQDQEIYEIESSPDMPDQIRKIDWETRKQISREEAIARRGTQNVITNSVYKIRQINGTPLPDATSHDSRESYRSYELIKKIWEMLEANRVTGNPAPKKRRLEQVVQKEPDKAQSPFFRNVSEMARWGVGVAETLDRQPLFWRSSQGNTVSKVIVLEDYGEARRLELLNNAAKNFLPEGAYWHMSAFGCGNYRLMRNEKDIGEGIQLYLDTSDEDNRCNLSTLKTAYDSALKRLGHGWERANLRDYPDILHTQSEETHVLFIKKEQGLPAEDTFVRFLAEPLGISHFIHCSDGWKNKRPNQGPMPTYLWIRKDKLEEVTQTLNISLPPHFSGLLEH